MIPSPRQRARRAAKTYQLDVEVVTADDLAKRLIDAFRAEDYRPPRLPVVALKVLELSRRADVDAGAFQKVLEQDSELAGRVLAMSQSALYSRKSPPVSLRDAVVRLGAKTLTSLVLQEAMAGRVFRAEGFGTVMEDVRKHSMANAYVARAVARFAGLRIEGRVAEEDAFLAGLMHESGTAAALALVGQACSRKPGALPFEMAWRAIDEVHARASGWLTKHWGLPSHVAEAVRRHHRPEAAQGIAADLAACVGLADVIASERGHEVPGDDEPGMKERCCKILRVGPAALASIEAYADKACEQVT